MGTLFRLTGTVCDVTLPSFMTPAAVRRLAFNSFCFVRMFFEQSEALSETPAPVVAEIV